jgi:hypothetical protein
VSPTATSLASIGDQGEKPLAGGKTFRLPRWMIRQERVVYNLLNLGRFLGATRLRTVRVGDERVILVSRTFATVRLWLGPVRVNIVQSLSEKFSAKGLTTSPAPA